MMNPRTDKLVRRTTVVATITASYFLLTADYGPEPNALDPGKKNVEIELETVNMIYKLVRRTIVVATITASYFLLTADYGPEPNALDPIKKAIQSAESSVKEFFVGSKNQSQESKVEKLDSNSGKKLP